MEVIHLDSVDSTNNYLKSRLDDYADRDVAVFAIEQTAGRGNGQNSWHSAKGENLTFSVLVHPHTVAPAYAFVLSQAMALALSDALATWIPQENIRVKWPNDIYIVPQGLKLSGTLIETSLSAGRMQTAIIGVGLNVNERVFPIELPNPVSMSQILDHSVVIEDVERVVLNAFSKYYDMVVDGQYKAIRALYHSRLYLLDTEAEYIDGQGTFRGTIKGVSDVGHLIVADSQGETREYDFKEIKFKTK